MAVRQPKKVFKFRSYLRLDDKLAQRVGERLTELGKGDHMHASANAIVADARNDKSPLHSLFEWDDAIAANEQRITEAKRIRDGVFVLEGGGEQVVSSPVSRVVLPRKARTYVPANLTPRDQQVRDHASEELEAWLSRYGEEEAFAMAVVLVRRAVEKLRKARTN